MATATCPHGFAPSSCLICQTLGIGGSGGASPSKPVERRTSTSVEVLSGRPRRRWLGLRLTGLAVVVVAAVLVVWWVAAAVWALLRVLELLAVAVVAGYGGWRLGVHHGRRQPR